MKNRLLILLAIALASNAYAQLTVRNSSFIFVDGSGFTDTAGVAPLFVTDEVNLVEADSKIYLRNEAQLIQGGTAENSGLGQLSTYQRGTVSQYNFNYWCSPVGNTTANTTTNTNFIPDNNIYGRDGADLISSTIAPYTSSLDGTANPFVISNRWIFSYDVGGVYSDWNYIGSNGSSTLPGFGFTMKGVSGTDVNNNSVGNNQLYDFRGKPNSGEIIIPVLAPVAGVPQFTLTGNPYPSALDARDFFHLDPENQLAIAGTGSGALLFWEQNSSSHEIASYIGGYALYTIDTSGLVSYVPAPWTTYDGAGAEVGGIGSSPNNTPGVNAPGRYLPIGQGFMIEGATTNNVYFRNTYREFWKESSGNSHFFRQNNSPSSDNNDNSVVDNGNELPNDYMRFRVLFDIEHNSNFFSRELLVNMVDYATDSYDYGMEAKLPEVLPSDAYFTYDNIPFGILAVPFLEERRIPLTIKVDHQQNVRFRVYALQNFDESQPIYLHDIDADLYIDLRTQNYSITLPAGVYDSRFEITFQAETLSTNEITDESFTVFQNTKESILTILNPNGIAIQSVSLFDISGKIVISETRIGNQLDYHYSTKSMSDGVYVASITTDDNQVISKKVIIKN
jgi:hypothetical protein